MSRTRVGPYELLEILGQGGMATVYRAYQPSMDRHVAIKIMHQGLALEATNVERFQREARLIARLEHPHILPVYDFDGAHTPQYIVMRFLPGGTLRDAITDRLGERGDGPVVLLLRQVASALDYAHRQGIVHRDLKPSNVMVDDEGNAFLTDFGIARLLARDEVVLTQAGTVVGTPGYMAPEQAAAEGDVGPAADIYSLGVLAFELLTGTLPFEASSPLAMVLLHLNQPPPSAQERNPRLPAAVDAVLARALAKRPPDRFPRAAELVEALAGALGHPTAPLAPSIMPSRAHATSLGERTEMQARTEQNKLVTVLCVNAAEFAEMASDDGGTEAARVAQQSLWDAVLAVVRGNDGVPVAHSDTSLLAVWGADTTREDDAERAVRTALAIRDGGDAGGLRISVHTGLVLLTPTTAAGTATPYTASGATVGIATRLAERADDGILIGHDTFREVRGVFDLIPAEDLPIRSRRATDAIMLPTYRVIAAKARAFRVRTRGIEGVETALVGRRAELEMLQKAFLTVAEDHEVRAVTVVGGAGLGKSRLLDAFDAWAELRPERFFLFRGRATEESRLTPFALLRDLLAFRFDILEDDPPAAVRDKIEKGMARLLRQEAADEETVHLVAHLTGFAIGDSRFVDGLAGDAAQLAARARRLLVRFLGRLADIQPVLMEVEEAHLADDASLDLLMEALSEHRARPLLLVFLARPALLERRPAWAGGDAQQRRITLEPLDRHDSRELVREILKKAVEVPLALRDLLVERAEGNPLFLEELIKMLIEDRVIVKASEDQWHVEPTRLRQLPVPPTLAGLLQARLDTLLVPERAVLQRAAVIGRVFSDQALAALDSVDDTAGHVADLAGTLRRLVERGFAYRRESSSLEGATDYVFAQSMLRDLIYDSLLRRQRSTCHATLARWLATSRRGDEALALIAEHFEKAGEAELAIDYLARAAARASSVCAFAEARSFFDRAIALSTPQATPARGAPAHVTPAATPPAGPPDPRRLRLHLELGALCRLLGDYAAATAHLASARAIAAELGETRALAAALFESSQLALAH
jgi:tRNA A-37 threonylcarbamoyl transferase component Bud32/tetratricopeptide (TPR) repeat protein